MTDNRFDIVLASASPRRHQLLAALGVPFRLVPSHVDEESAGQDAVSLARHLALSKAVEVALREPEALVIGADTVVSFQGGVLGKPADPEQAVATLAELRGRWHEVITAVAVVSPGMNAAYETTTSRVRMRDYRHEEIRAYVASGSPMDKAGAYGIQDADFHPVAEYDGCYCSVMGLPAWRTANLLRNAGIAVQPSLERLPAVCGLCPYAPLTK